MTSGTLFAWHTLPLKADLMAIAVFGNEVMGKSMLAFSRNLDFQYKTTVLLAHKPREGLLMHALGIHQDMSLLPVDLLVRIITAGIDVRAAFFGAFHALAVDDAGDWTGLPIDWLAACLVEFIRIFKSVPSYSQRWK
jgi:hypothetical protein